MGREFLENAHRPSEVAIANMDYPEIKGGEVPLRHDLDKPAVAQQLWLHQRWKIPDAGTGQQRSRETGIVVH